MKRLDGAGPHRRHTSDEFIAEVQRVVSRYPVGTIRRVVLCDLRDPTGPHHVKSIDVEYSFN